jgi:pimeloyl-ACP methyl ester carboxylesterase
MPSNTIGSKKFWLVSLALIVILAVAFAVEFMERPVSLVNNKVLIPIHVFLAGGRSQSVTVSGIRVHYDEFGPSGGPPVVLVHGLGGRAEDWLNLSAYLVKAGYRVYTPDLPGYGDSEKPASFSYSIPDEAAIVVGYLDALGLKQVDLGGISMGGWIVQRLAADHPDRVERLMLFDPAGIKEAPAWNTSLFTPTSPDEVNQLNALLNPNPKPVPRYVAKDVVRLSNRNGWVIQRALQSMLSGNDITDDILPGLKMPMLIVWGTEDRVFPLEQGEKMHELAPQSQLAVIPGCGHLAAVQCTAQIGPDVVQFIEK